MLARLSFPPGVAKESFNWQTTALGVHLNANAVHSHSGVLTLLSTAANLFYVCRQQQWESFVCKCSALALRCADSVVVCCRLHARLSFSPAVANDTFVCADDVLSASEAPPAALGVARTVPTMLLRAPGPAEHAQQALVHLAVLLAQSWGHSV